MHRYTILLNPYFSANTQTSVSAVTGGGQSYLTVTGDDYYVNNVNGLNLGITTPSNVREYLNDPANEKIIADFFGYLTGNTNQNQFREIFYSDQKLSNVFNKYYSRSILTGVQSPTAYINQQLTSTTTINYSYSNFNWNGYAPIKYPFLAGQVQEVYGSTRFTKFLSTLATFTVEESYYVPVFLKPGSNQIAPEGYDFPTKIVNTIYINPNPLISQTA